MLIQKTKKNLNSKNLPLVATLTSQSTVPPKTIGVKKALAQVEEGAKKAL